MYVTIKSCTSVFSNSYNIEDCHFDYSGWHDDVGQNLVKKAKSIPDRFNYLQSGVWKKIEKMGEIDANAISYTSNNRYVIEGLRLND